MMLCPGLLLSVIFLFSITFAEPNLFNDGQLSAILGTSFGIPGANATFDYVVVGGGTAGLTVATRLAEDPTVSVAVVEAGGFYEIDNGNLSVVPGSASAFTGSDPKNFQPLVDWGFSTIPQPGANNRRIHYARGKTLGGSSARNFLVYHRSTVDAYRKWADQVGDQSYTFDRFLPYFKKSCHYTAPTQALYVNSSNNQDPSAFSPGGGPLQVSFSNAVDPFGTWAQRGLKAVGLREIDGLNSGRLIGSAYGTLTVDPTNAHRSSSESSFLQSAVRKGIDIRVYKNTLAQRILFNSSNVATGVAVTTAGTYGVSSLNYTLSARKEVIVSAGAFQSPQLLMVSGIGPCETLKKYNIPCHHNLPGVGQNLWDHISFGVSNRVNVQTASAGQNDASLAAKFVELFLRNATGPLSIYGAGYYGFEKLPEPYRSALPPKSKRDLDDNFPPDWPELEWLPVSGYTGNNFNKQKSDPRDGSNYATLTTALVSPLSRGTVSIQGADMSTPPIIDPKYFSEQADADLAIQAIRRQRQIWKILRGYGVAIGEEAFPGANVTTDAEILNHVASTFIEIYHASATCKMGRKTDRMAVLDSSAKVFGTSRLRVVDASSFPFLPPGHPQATVYALAEKIADEILRDGKRE